FDVDGDAITVEIVNGPTSGTLNVLANGTFRYIPEEAFTGVVFFQYQITDGVLSSDLTTVRILVNPPLTDAELRETSDTVEEGVAVEESEEEAEPQDDESANPFIAELDREETSSNERMLVTARSVFDASSDVRAMGSDYESSPGAISVAASFRMNSASSNSSSIVSRSETTLAPNATLIGIADFESKLMWDDMESIQEQFSENFSSPLVAAGAFAGFSGALSVGYVLWTIRGGLLATSLLVHLPAWSFVDPLLVLSDLDDEDDDDDETLEGMLDEKPQDDADSDDAVKSPSQVSGSIEISARRRG
ncbi:MAG: Ig-like domain-containing protein, partial [Planctomycetota bacterium]